MLPMHSSRRFKILRRFRDAKSVWILDSFVWNIVKVLSRTTKQGCCPTRLINHDPPHRALQIRRFKSVNVTRVICCEATNTGEVPMLHLKVAESRYSQTVKLPGHCRVKEEATSTYRSQHSNSTPFGDFSVSKEPASGECTKSQCSSSPSPSPSRAVLGLIHTENTMPEFTV